MPVPLNANVVQAPAEDFSALKRAAASDSSFISLAVAEPYKQPFPHALEAYKRAIDDGFVRYGLGEGVLPLREAIAEKLRARNGIVVDPGTEVRVTHGAGHALLLALLAFLAPGDEALTADPSFPLNFGTTRLIGAVPLSCPIDGPGGLEALPDRMAEAISPRTRLIVLHSPNNPTGDLLPQSVLERIAELAERHDLGVLSDEVYERFVYDGRRHFSVASLPGMLERTITVHGFSKEYCLSGLRVGYMSGGARLLAACGRIQQNDGAGANPASQMAALAALTGPQDELDRWAVEFDGTRRRTVETLNAIQGVSCPLPASGYFAFPDVGMLGDVEALWQGLLENARVGVAPGSWYSQRPPANVRICYAAAPPERVAEALRRMVDYMGTLPRSGAGEPVMPTKTRE